MSSPTKFRLAPDRPRSTVIGMVRRCMRLDRQSPDTGARLRSFRLATAAGTHAGDVRDSSAVAFGGTGVTGARQPTCWRRRLGECGPRRWVRMKTAIRSLTRPERVGDHQVRLAGQLRLRRRRLAPPEILRSRRHSASGPGGTRLVGASAPTIATRPSRLPRSNG